MEYTTLGASGRVVSRVGFGCAAMGGYDYGSVDDEESIRAVHKALDCGITLFDVADVYGFGHAEAVLGRALRGISAEVVVATKVGVRWNAETGSTVRDISETYIRQAVEASLRRLQVERLDICQLHWPVPGITPAEAMLTLRRLQTEGKIDAVGVCNASLPWIESAQSSCRLDVLQLPCNVLEQENLPTLRRARHAYHMSTFAYNGLMHGLLAGKFSRGSKFEGTDLRNRVTAFKGAQFDKGLLMAAAVAGIASNLNKAAAQIAVRWLLEREEVSCVLAGIKTPEQAEVNALAADWSLPDDASAELSRIAQSLNPSRVAADSHGIGCR